MQKPLAPAKISKTSANISNQKKPADLKQQITQISSFIRKQVRDSHTNGAIIGISGGVDSAVAAALCARAIGPRKVLGVFLFENSSKNSKDVADAHKLAEQLRIRTKNVPLTVVIDGFQKAFSAKRFGLSRITLANIKARSRMTVLYAIANQKRLLVCGTSDRSEVLLGYFTKYGDGAADFEPISHLFKTEVRALASELGLPLDIVNKPSSPNLWSHHRASDELPADYDVLDRILSAIFDSNMTPNQASKKLGVPLRIVQDALKMYQASEHKRELPAPFYEPRNHRSE
jgi:NAD+ synthase